MPIAKGTAPSGEKFNFYVSKGTTAEEAPALARSAYFRRQAGIDVTQPPPLPQSTVGGELARGAESLVSALRTTAGAAFGDDEAAALAALERSEGMAQKYGEGPSFQAVRDAEGILPTVGTALGQIPRAVAGQGAQLATTAGGAAAGAALGTMIAPGPGTLVGGGLGALASLIPQFAGYNIERQAEADIAEGRPVDIETGKAVGTAALQAVPELLGQYFILGKGLIGPLLGKPANDIIRAASKADAEKLLKTANEKLFPSLGRTKTTSKIKGSDVTTTKYDPTLGVIGRGVATGAAVEMPTEVAQQVLERAQAGLDILSEEALSEYGEAAYLAATVGGTLGPIGSVSNRNAARRQRDELATFTGKSTEEEPLGLPAPALGLPAPASGSASGSASPSPSPSTSTPPVESYGELLGPETSPEPVPTPALPPPTRAGDGTAIIVTPEGLAYPEKYAEAFEEAIANEEQLRKEGAQRELFTELMDGEKTRITEQELKELGLTSKKLKDGLPKLDLANPADAQAAIELIVKYAENPTVKSKYKANRMKALGLLNMPVLTRVERAAAQESGQQSAEGQITEQITTDEGAKRTEEDIAYAGRAEQLAGLQRQDDLKTELSGKQEAAQQAAVERAASLPEGTPTAMEAAMQPELARGVSVEGQQQLEMSGVEPRDAAAQETIVSADLNQQIASEQRALEASESQGQEQIAMLGPRGGVTPEAKGKGARKQPAAPAEAAPAAQQETAPEAEAEPVSESAAVEEKVAAAPPQARDRVAEAAAKAKEAKEAKLAASRADAAIAREEQNQRTANQADLKNTTEQYELDAEKFKEEFGEIADNTEDRAVFLAALADESINGNAKQKAAAQAKIEIINESFSQDVKDDLVAAQNSIRRDLKLPLPARALAATSIALEPEVVELLREGKLVEALDILAQSKNKEVARVAKAVSLAILEDGGTKVTLESNLMGTDGRLLAGTFDPKTNTIIINKDLTPTAHVLLHEALHAVTSHELANKSSPITKQLQTLFDNVKDRLEDSYGATNLDEFVAEAFSNPEFQAKLASMDTKGNKLPVWKQFVNAVLNAVRKALKIPFTKTTTARSEVDKLVTELMSPAPEYRNATRLNMAATAKEEGKLLGDVLDNFGGPVTKEMVKQFNDTMPGLTRTRRQWFMNILPLNSIADFIKDSENSTLRELGGELDSLFKIIQQKNGSRQEYLLKTKDTAKLLDKLFAKLGDAQRKLFNKIVMASTLRRVDPSRDREYYEKFRFSYIDQDGKEVRGEQLFDTKEERDAAVAKLQAADTKKELTFAVTDPNAGKLEQYDLLEKDFKDLDPEAQKAYSTLRDAYSEAYTELRMAIVERINAVDAVTEEALFAKRAYKDRVLKDLLNKESIEPYFPLFRKGDFWYNHQGFDPYTGNLEQFKAAFESDKKREEYAREVFIVSRQPILDSKITTVVEPRDAAIKRAKAKGATDQEAEDAGVEAVLEGTRAERPTNARGEKTAVDIGWAQGVLGDVVRKKGEAAKRAKDKALEDGLSEEEANKIADQTLRAGSAIETIVQDAMLEAMPERSLERAFKKRQDTSGAQQDAIDVFRQRMPAFMGQVDNIRFDIPLTQASNSLDRVASKANGTDDQEYAQQIAKQGKDYIAFVRDPQIASYTRRLKSAGFLMTLGFNMSSAVVNSFILPVAVLPFLAGTYGFRESSAAMYRAMKLYMGTGMQRRLQPFGGAPEGTEFDGPSLANLDPENLPEEYKPYKALIEELVSRGAANASTVGDMLDTDNPTGGAFDRNLTRVNAISGFLFHQGERLNRQVTAMAGYDLAMAAQKKKNKGAEVTEEQKNDIISQVILDVEHTNSGALIETAPKLAQGNILSVLLMYKRFGVSMAYLQMKMARQALGIGNYSEQQNKEAKKQLVGLFGMSGLLAGAQGLPLYGVVAATANMLFLDEEDDDFDSLFAAYIGEGPYSGVLNEIFDMDIAPRIGMTNLLFRTLPNKEYDGLLEYSMELAGGPLFGIVGRMSRSGTLLKEGEYRRGIEGLLPAGLSAPLKSIRYATEGVTTLRGDPIIEDMSMRSLMGQFFGFAPAGYTKQLEINARDKRVDRTITQKRTRLLRERYVAYRVGDFDGVREADQEIQEFNQRNPEVRITGDTKARSLRQHKITSQIMRQLGGITISPRRLEKIIRKRLEETGESDFFL